VQDARTNARYQAKYLGKDLEVAPFRGQRYRVAHGYQPEAYGFDVDGTMEEAYWAAISAFGGEEPSSEWWSTEDPAWDKPPVVKLEWSE